LHECRDWLIEKKWPEALNNSEQDAGCDLAVVHGSVITAPRDDFEKKRRREQRRRIGFGFLNSRRTDSHHSTAARPARGVGRG
jgi:hypothetical protein